MFPFDYEMAFWVCIAGCIGAAIREYRLIKKMKAEIASLTQDVNSLKQDIKRLTQDKENTAT